MKQKEFVNLPITRKLHRLQAVTVGLALVFTLLVTSITEILAERRQMQIDALSTGNMIGFNAAAALLFNDSRSASEILAALHNKPSIVAAQLYTIQGTPFAHYIADSRFAAFPNSLSDAENQLQKNRSEWLIHSMIQPIVQNGDTAGYLYLMIDLHPMWNGLFRSLGQISIVMLVAFLLSTLYGRRLAALISAPLIRLSDLTQQVSLENNYTVRAKGEGENEIGMLVKSFNRMVERIQERDAELAKQRDKLEQEVEVRTADLRRAVAEAQAASIAKSQFLANMSHEIRTPMNGVLGMTELLLGTELNLSQRQFAETVFTSADSLLAIINDILDFSKIEAGKLELEEIDFNLIDLTDQMILLFFERAFSKKIDLKCEIDPAVPEAVRGDPYRLRQILSNLLSNAIKFTDDGSVTLHVGIANLEPNQFSEGVCLNFSVSDTGIGIGADARSKLFQSFSQADGSTTRKYGGTGLGLVICKELSRLMGGSIDIQSSPGNGATFIVQLPLHKALAPLSTEAILDTELSGKHILIVEDNPTNAKILKSYLLGFGMSARFAENAIRALELLDQTANRGGHYDAVLIDIKMQGMSGMELSQHIRNDARFAESAIVMMTSASGEEGLAKLADSCDLYLYRPLHKRILHDALLGIFSKNTSSGNDHDGLQGMRILLAEDNPVNQKLAAAMLDNLRCNVELAVNGVEALNIFKRGEIDLILMDCMMPEMDGYTATREIRLLEQSAGNRRLPILALTANAMEGDRKKCLDAGMDDYLAKPFLINTLRDKIIGLLKSNTPSIAAESVPRPKIASDTVSFDMTPLNTIRQMGGDALVTNVLQLFRSSAQQQVEILHDGILKQNTHAVHHAAHSLKSAAANIGGLYLAELARNLELAASNGSLTNGEQLLEGLKNEFQTVLQIISQRELS
jgi:signal transduction histidine kinase/DNA-binding response OmpR family regulator